MQMRQILVPYLCSSSSLLPLLLNNISNDEINYNNYGNFTQPPAAYGLSLPLAINAMVLAGFEPTALRTLKICSHHRAIEADGVSRFSSQVFFTQREWARIDMRDNFTYKKYQTCNIMCLISLYL